jgi:glutathionylspermidine synthase
MKRIDITERSDWKELAEEYGFRFHTMYGEPYWDESAYYAFTLEQIERDIEDPTAEIHQMCLEVVDHVVKDELLLKKFQIPERFWNLIGESWRQKDASLYSRIDLAYDATGKPAKLYENNADTPTSLYETGFWQWLWLEDKIEAGELPSHTDQFNSLQEKLIDRFTVLKQKKPNTVLHLACCKETEEDRGTVQYLEDCAQQAGIDCQFVFIEDIGHGEQDLFTDLDNSVIRWLFKLYPWEFMFREEYGALLHKSEAEFIEPLWKAVLSNKALLPMLWKLFPNHPNLLPSYFSDDPMRSELTHYVKKPIFAREGSNISIYKNGSLTYENEGPYGDEGYIYQAFYPLPRYGDNYALIGSWLVNDQPAGMSIREDNSQVTMDLSRYLPHVIL